MTITILTSMLSILFTVAIIACGIFFWKKLQIYIDARINALIAENNQELQKDIAKNFESLDANILELLNKRLAEFSESRQNEKVRQIWQRPEELERVHAKVLSGDFSAIPGIPELANLQVTQMVQVLDERLKELRERE